tara:strand:- start:1823 stop:2995 length:1173 start_codon:yes stop_codon:yes gene_type:complete
MKYLFVNPDAPVNKDVPNIGLAYAATHFGVKVVDFNTKLLPKDRFLSFEADVLGVSVKSLTFNESKRIAELYKKKYPDAKVKSISGFLDVQCCYPYVNFEDRIEYKEEFSDKYPFPKYELFDSFEMFLEKWQSGEWQYPIMSSQGCPYQCIYCMSRNRKWYARGAENCYEEVKHALDKYKIRKFQIVDDCFNLDKKRVLEFCRLVKPLKVGWQCTNGLRADRFDEDVAKAMVGSGCMNISFGVESSDSNVLAGIKKGETFEQIEKAVDVAKKYFKHVNGFFIIGLPGSTYKKDLKSVEWMVKKKIFGHFSYYIPFDKEMQYDKNFFGEPLSEEYSKEKQRRVYELTSSFNSSVGRGVFRRVLDRLRLVWMFDRKNLVGHLVDGVRLLGKL